MYILVPIRREGNISHLFISLATQRSMGEQLQMTFSEATSSIGRVGLIVHSTPVTIFMTEYCYWLEIINDKLCAEVRTKNKDALTHCECGVSLAKC